jgi:hypothetical protein
MRFLVISIFSMFLSLSAEIKLNFFFAPRKALPRRPDNGPYGCMSHTSFPHASQPAAGSKKFLYLKSIAFEAKSSPITWSQTQRCTKATAAAERRGMHGRWNLSCAAEAADPQELIIFQV